MKHRNFFIFLLITTLSLALYWSYRQLSREIPQMFPQVAKETPEEIVPAITFEDPDDVIERPQVSAIPAPSKQEMISATEPTSPPEIKIPTPSADNRFPVSPSSKILQTTKLPILPKLTGTPISTSFSIPKKLAPIVDFWRNIYGVYSVDQLIFHDLKHLQIVYSVLDFSQLNQQTLSESEKRAQKSELTKKQTEKILKILTELETQTDPLQLSEEARKVSELFQNIFDKDKYKKAKENLRTQTGLKERFRSGIERSGRYLSLFEPIFLSYGVPPEITRLAFVESTFWNQAYSKVGAAGLWQFMESSAKRYMIVNNYVDERYDPIIATHSAAKLLRHNYDLLGSWPLAINAYNSGPGNLQKAIQKLGTSDIAAIITGYETDSYSFASRNFYPSFLAALHVYENQDFYFGKVPREPLMVFDQLILPVSMSFPQISYFSQNSIDELRKLNPSFADEVFAGKFLVQAGSQVRITSGSLERFTAHFINFHDNAAQVHFHVLSDGENLNSLAKTYRLPIHELEKLNPNTNLEKGTVVLIPSLSTLVRE